jgi:hypothetical protein
MDDRVEGDGGHWIPWRHRHGTGYRVDHRLGRLRPWLRVGEHIQSAQDENPAHERPGDRPYDRHRSTVIPTRKRLRKLEFELWPYRLTYISVIIFDDVPADTVQPA